VTAESILPEAPQPPMPPSPPDDTALGFARLTLKRSGVVTKETFDLGERVVIGRFDQETGPVDVDLGPLPEAQYVSRQHAEIWRDETGGWHVKDLESSNGTFVRSKGQPKFERAATELPLADGDEVALGNARFAFSTTTP
jgi:pSer/pThr/pTyr-binding forkhead associated (FHA) protein